LLPEFLYVGGKSKHDVGIPFHHFGYFFVFNSFRDMICLNDQQDLDFMRVVDQQFYSRRLFAALAGAVKNSVASVIARI
jgi:hypothetical protein